MIDVFLMLLNFPSSKIRHRADLWSSSKYDVWSVCPDVIN